MRIEKLTVKVEHQNWIVKYGPKCSLLFMQYEENNNIYKIYKEESKS